MKKIILFLMLAVFMTAGCGNDKKPETKTGDKKDSVTSKDPVKTTPETSGDKKDGTQQTENTTGDLNMSPGLPSNFPADVPKPKDAKPLGFFESSEGTVVTFEAPGKITDIVTYYKDELKKAGYQLSEGEPVTDKGGLLEWKKDSKSVGLMLGYNAENATQLVITYK